MTNDQRRRADATANAAADTAAADAAASAPPRIPVDAAPPTTGTDRPDATARAYGALVGLAIGDALGMPTQSMAAEHIVQAYGGPIRDFLDATADQPIAPSMHAGAITDDTEQALLLADRLIADRGELDVTAYAHDLLDWEARMKAKGSFDLLGPSTKAALEALSRGVDPELTGRTGTTNGGAMRAAPVGIAFAPGPALAQAARRSCIVTHNTVQGIEATTLVAAAVSYGIEGADPLSAMHRAVAFVAAQPHAGHWSAKASVLARTRAALAQAEADRRAGAVSDGEFADRLRTLGGTSVEANESVPAAFAIAARYADRPFDALCEAASVGGDTDTIAAMAGAMLGAAGGPDIFGAQRREFVEQVNELRLRPLAGALAALRQAGAR